MQITEMDSETETRDGTMQNGSAELQYSRELAIFEAAASGNHEKISYLLSSEDAGSLRQGRGCSYYCSHYSIKHALTALHIAANNGRLECLRILIDHGANLDARDELSSTALHRAAEKGHHLCVRALLESGADFSLPILHRSSAKAPSPYVEGSTALHLAAKNNHVNCIEELLSYGADYNAVDVHGHTSLYVAAKCGFHKCVLTHLKHPHFTDILSLPSYDTSDTPLHFAVKFRMVECVKELVRLGSDVHHLNKRSVSPLHLSYCNSSRKAHRDVEIFKCLVLEGNNVDKNNLFGHVLQKNRRMAKVLFELGVDINVIEADKLVEKEFFMDKDDDIFRCLIKCLPVLPRVGSLNVVSCVKADLQASTLPDSIEVKLFLDGYTISIEVHDKRFRNMGCKIPLSLFPVKEPLVGMIYNRVVEELKYYNKSSLVRQFGIVNYLGVQCYVKKFLLLLKKQLWYEQMASKPLTLLHCCRITIRKNIHFSNLHLIQTLPVPEKLRSYLMFEWGD